MGLLIRQFPFPGLDRHPGHLHGAYHLLHGLALSLILLYRDYGLSATLIGLILGPRRRFPPLSASGAAGCRTNGGGATSCCSVAWFPPQCGPARPLPSGGLAGTGVIGSGLSYGLIDSPGKALMADNLAEPKPVSWRCTCVISCSTWGGHRSPARGHLWPERVRRPSCCSVPAICCLASSLSSGSGWQVATPARRPGPACAAAGALARQGFLAADHGPVADAMVYAQFESPPHPVSDPRGDAGGGAAHRLAGDDQRADHSDAAVCCCT